MKIEYRPMHATDIGRVPDDCQGTRAALTARITEIGSAAMLAFDGEQHVAQLQFRRYDPGLRSAKGIWHPDYWGDFGDQAPDLPPETLNLFCYHVGQLTAGDDRSPAYQGKGIGVALLDATLAWAQENGCAAVVAKFTPADRAVMGFMGGQPAATYEQRGFEVLESWIDSQLADAVFGRQLVAGDADPDLVARVGACVRFF